MKPDVSVVIPLYNKERYIRRAVNSVLRQTFQDFECVVVDSSTDGSTAIVNRINDPRIVHVSLERSTAAGARNKGVETARSDLVAFLDADDEWQPDHLETLLHLRKEFPDAGLYATAHVKIKPDGNPMVMLFYGIPRPPWEGCIPNYLKTSSRGDEPVHSSSCAVPRSVLTEKGGFSETVRYGEDQLLWGRIALTSPVAFSWNGLAIFHTEAMGRTCDMAHVVQEHPFSVYLRQELAMGTIPPEKIGDSRAYIRRKQLAEIFSRFIVNQTPGPCNNTGQPARDYPREHVCTDSPSLDSEKIPTRVLIRLYNSSFHDTLRRLYCRISGCYDPGKAFELQQLK